ncbi:MAG: hypothetical protein ACOYIE_04525 [Agathobaculum sp.]|uniref:hypothetical protein n=1 Tax=Eubacteriales TaxID=186802 RepID=UPI0011C2336D|nr:MULTISPECIES: hypothetical protein [Anaerotruncus]
MGGALPLRGCLNSPSYLIFPKQQGKFLQGIELFSGSFGSLKHSHRTASQNIWIHCRDIGILNDVNAEFDITPIEDIYGNDFEIVYAEQLPQAI